MDDLGRFHVFDFFLGIFQKPSKTYQNLVTLVVTTRKAPVVTRYMLSFSPQLQGTHFGTGFPPKGSLISKISTKQLIFRNFPVWKRFQFQFLSEKRKTHRTHLAAEKNISFFLAYEARTFGMNSFFHEFKIHAPFGSPGCRWFLEKWWSYQFSFWSQFGST